MKHGWTPGPPVISPARREVRSTRSRTSCSATTRTGRRSCGDGRRVRAGLVADCFHLARRIRELDMRASPYDLTAYGYEPVAIETAEGRSTYQDLQRGFAAEAAALRERLQLAARALVRTA